MENSNLDLDLNQAPSSTIANYCVCNACVPPESSSKNSKMNNETCGSTKAYPYIHMCPRMMLGSDIMLKAQQEDLKTNSNLTNYNYAVAGHDRIDKSIANLDPETSGETCGQCYELIFEDDAQMNPLIVQAFNTDAPSGTNVINYDLYMPVGGYGAFNSVIDDKKFKNTTTSNSFSI